MDAAVSVFRKGGFNGVSLLDLGHAMKLSPSSIYKAFADKRAIFRAALDRYIAVRSAQLTLKLEAATDGLSRIMVFLDHYVESATEAEGRAGCLVINAAVEGLFADAGTAERVSASLARLEALLTDLIKEGQRDGSLRSDLDALATARMIVALVQGFRVIGKLGRSLDDFAPVSRQVARLLQGSGGRRTSGVSS